MDFWEKSIPLEGDLPSMLADSGKEIKGQRRQEVGPGRGRPGVKVGTELLKALSSLGAEGATSWFRAALLTFNESLCPCCS